MMNKLFYTVLFLVLLACKGSDTSSKTSNSTDQVSAYDAINTTWWVMSKNDESIELTTDSKSLPPSRFREQWTFDLENGRCSKTKPGKDDRPATVDGSCQLIDGGALVVMFPNTPADTLRITKIENSLLTLEY